MSNVVLVPCKGCGQPVNIPGTRLAPVGQKCDACIGTDATPQVMARVTAGAGIVTELVDQAIEEIRTMAWPRTPEAVDDVVELCAADALRLGADPDAVRIAVNKWALRRAGAI